MNYQIDKDKITAIIPARGGSKGVPHKNVRLLCGYPLLAYSIAACQMSMEIDRIILSTDDAKIAETGIKYGAEVPFLRPCELAGDNSGDIEFVWHTINWLQEHEGKIPEYFAHIRPTTPLRNPEILDEAIKTIRKAPGCTSMRSAHEAPESPYKWFLLNGDGTFRSMRDEFSNDDANADRNQFPKTYIPDGYVDVLKTECIIQTGFLHGDRMLAFLSPFCVEVDTEDEFHLLEYEINKNGSFLFDYLEKHKSHLKGVSVYE